MADARGMGLSMGFGVLGFPRWRQRVVFPFQYLSNIVVYGWQFAHAPQAPDADVFTLPHRARPPSHRISS